MIVWSWSEKYVALIDESKRQDKESRAMDRVRASRRSTLGRRAHRHKVGMEIPCVAPLHERPNRDCHRHTVHHLRTERCATDGQEMRSKVGFHHMRTERRNVMKGRNLSVTVIVGFLALAILAPQPAMAQEKENEYGALLKVLSNSKHSLADGIRQATKSTEVPISAKFELDDNGKLSLSVYTAENGLTTDAEHNVLKELSGS